MCTSMCACVYMHARLYPTFCHSMNFSPPGSSIHGILQARILEWVAIPFSKGSSQSRERTHISCVSCTASRFFTTEPRGKLKVHKVLWERAEVLHNYPSTREDGEDFPGGSNIRESTCSAGDLGREYHLEKGMATHSSILAWRIP